MEKKKTLVAGAGISGMNACRLLLADGEAVLLYDGDAAKDEAALRAQLGDPEGLSVVLGDLTEETARQASLCVVSPGIPLDAPFLDVLRRAGVPVVSEIELAWRHEKGMVTAITGTNGKTTTTALTGEMFEQAGCRTFVVGNIGHAYTQEAANTTPDSVTVAEISSFQLETIDGFHPHISAVLNITPDHLNRHGTMDNYAAVKLSITKNQTPEDYCILNYEDERLRASAPSLAPKVLFFSSARPLSEGAWLDGESIRVRCPGLDGVLCGIHDMKLLGRHNYENVMAAALMALAAGLPAESVRQTIRTFNAVEHRIEFVAEKDGVVYYNDSKGTNPDASIKAVEAMVRPTVLIAGGYDKGGEFDEFLLAGREKVRSLILLGATAEKIEQTARRCGMTRILRVGSLEEAVDLAKKEAVPGDAVLLSPACASWDMFKNYEVRGRLFKELVRGEG